MARRASEPLTGGIEGNAMAFPDGCATTVRHERRPLAKPFVTSHGICLHTDLITVKVEADGWRGVGEATPTDYLGDTVDGSLREAEDLLRSLRSGRAWPEIHAHAAPGPARNAVDCAIWDLRAKRAGTRAWTLAGVPTPEPTPTVMTVGMASPVLMAAEAAGPPWRDHAILKLKLGDAADDVARVAAIRSVARGKRLIVDANEGWSIAALVALMPQLEALGVELIEQPLPPAHDEALAGLPRCIPIAADESCRTRADLPDLVGRYDVVNIKLDKTGGLTEALALASAARAAGLAIMVGCMEGTSLAMAPATLLMRSACFVDLDGPLLIGADRDHPLSYAGGLVHPPSVGLWG